MSAPYDWEGDQGESTEEVDNFSGPKTKPTHAPAKKQAQGTRKRARH